MLLRVKGMSLLIHVFNSGNSIESIGSGGGKLGKKNYKNAITKMIQYKYVIL